MRPSSLSVFVCAVLLAGCDVSAEQEVEFGRENARRINEAIPLVTDPAAVAYVSALGRRIATKTSRADLDWQFAIVNSSEVNAFALPGGFIYVNRGLVERAATLDRLAGVLGHEIGHVVERHSVDQMKKTTGANIGVTIICMVTSLCESGVSRAAINIAGSAILAKYSRADELEADSQAVVNVINAGISPAGIPEFFRTLMQERQRDPSMFDTFFASHPVEESRVEYTRRLIEDVEDRRLLGLATDDAGYQAFREALRRLPPPPPPRALPTQ